MTIDRRTFLAGLGGTAAVGAVDGLKNPSVSRAAVSAQSATSGLNPEVLRSLANRDGEFLLMARYWDARIRLQMGDQRYQLVVGRGAVTDFRPEAEAVPADVTIAGPREAWVSGFALRGLTVTGDQVGHVLPYYGAIARLVALIRGTFTGTSRDIGGKEIAREFDTAVGRYVYVGIQGVQHRVYFEEAGQGVPLLLQHTAGADSREWRFMLEDAELQKRFRMIAYDLPFHGRSMPPTGQPWWTRDYRLTRELLIDSVVAISRALKADRGVFLGCALGGALALDLARYRPDAFRAVVGINASLGAGPANRAAAQATIDSYSHPRVFNNRYMGISIYGNTSPDAPETYRREIQWIYNQSAPGVLGGDFNYYSIEHHLTPEDLAQIDTTKIAVHLLSGEYGSSSGPTGAAAAAAQIKGATHAVIKGANYLPMTDDYSRFREAVIPVLNRLVNG